MPVVRYTIYERFDESRKSFCNFFSLTTIYGEPLDLLDRYANLKKRKAEEVFMDEILFETRKARSLTTSVCPLGPLSGGITAAALYIFFCYFDFEIVTAANKVQHRADVAAGPGATVTVQVVSLASPETSATTADTAVTTGYDPRIGDTKANIRKV